MKNYKFWLIVVFMMCVTVVACFSIYAISHRYQYVEQKTDLGFTDYYAFDNWTGKTHLR